MAMEIGARVGGVDLVNDDEDSVSDGDERVTGGGGLAICAEVSGIEIAFADHVGR